MVLDVGMTMVSSKGLQRACIINVMEHTPNKKTTSFYEVVSA
jgi:hypothetical protein